MSAFYPHPRGVQDHNRLMSESEVVEAVKNVVAEQLGHRSYRLLLVGSRAKGTNTPTADFDFVVDASPPLEQAEYFNLLGAVEQIPTLRQIDLVDLATASDAFISSALPTAVEIARGA